MIRCRFRVFGSLFKSNWEIAIHTPILSAYRINSIQTEYCKDRRWKHNTENIISKILFFFFSKGGRNNTLQSNFSWSWGSLNFDTVLNMTVSCVSVFTVYRFGRLMLVWAPNLQLTWCGRTSPPGLQGRMCMWCWSTLRHRWEHTHTHTYNQTSSLTVTEPLYSDLYLRVLRCQLNVSFLFLCPKSGVSANCVSVPADYFHVRVCRRWQREPPHTRQQ